MANTYPENQGRPDHHPESDCQEKESPTGKCIATSMQVFCTNLRGAKSDQESAEKAYHRSLVIYGKKKKLFEWTEHNYRLYRDFDICVDSELTAATTSLTANVKSFSTLSQNLYNNLKKAVTMISDLKTKVGLLGDAAYILDKYKHDQANSTQWTLLTGKVMENCKPEHEHHHHWERPESCADADDIYCDLIEITKKVLIPDVNSLFGSATDTVGIQTFTNIDNLTTQQASFTTAAAALVTKVQATAKTRRADLDGVQTDLSTAVQDCTNAGIAKFNKMSMRHAAFCTVKFLCCPECSCVRHKDPEVREPHLIDCECRICKIGEKVRSAYRSPGEPDRDCGCK
jgi:cytochrome c556